MKICVAQTRPVKGDIEINVTNHKKFIHLAILHGAGIIIFPELSLTGYEPKLAKALATTKADSRLDDFQKISDSRYITIGVGFPATDTTGTCISMAIFQPQRARQIYSKKYLHPDEEKYFVSGQGAAGLREIDSTIAFAICYELSVPGHSAEAFKNGATIYITSVAKSPAGVEKATESLAGIAKKYAMTVLMSNCVGPCDDFESGGKSAIWNNKGVLAAQLNDTSEGILIIDTVTGEVIEKRV